MTLRIFPDVEAIASEVDPSPPRPNMANEVLSRLSNFFRPRFRSGYVREVVLGQPQDAFTTHGDGVFRELEDVIAHPGDFPPPPCWKIVCIGVATMTDKYDLDDLGCLPGKTEEEILRELARVLSQDKSSPFPEHDVITFNGRGFDLPVICARAARYGIQLPFWSSRWHYRYNESPHFDLLDYWSAYGGSPKVSLSQMARLFGLPGKRQGEDGNSVAGMIAEGRLTDVQHYCLSDVVQTAGVFLRTEYFRGRLDKNQYRAAAMRLLEACEGAFAPAEALSWISEKTDRKIFLLEE